MINVLVCAIRRVIRHEKLSGTLVTEREYERVFAVASEAGARIGLCHDVGGIAGGLGDTVSETVAHDEDAVVYLAVVHVFCH